MCGRYMIKVQVSDLVDRFRVDRDEMDEHGPTVSYNVAPTQIMPVIVHSGGSNRIRHMQWGLIAEWAKDLGSSRPALSPSSRQRPMINARIEGILDKPMFGAPVRERRCLVPAAGFFEWQKNGSSKTPYFIHRRDGGLFAFAGIYNEWRGPGGEVVDTYAILTTQPNALMSPLHDRMPLILPGEEGERAWLRTAPGEVAALLEQIAVPYRDSELEAYPVSALVNSTNNDAPNLIERATAGSKPPETPMLPF